MLQVCMHNQLWKNFSEARKNGDHKETKNKLFLKIYLKAHTTLTAKDRGKCYEHKDIEFN